MLKLNYTDCNGTTAIYTSKEEVVSTVEELTQWIKEECLENIGEEEKERQEKELEEYLEFIEDLKKETDIESMQWDIDFYITQRNDIKIELQAL